MNLNRYKIRKKAVEDLENIWLYTYKNWSLEQADKYYGLIISEIEFVSKNFLAGKSIDHIKKGYRAKTIQSHTIFYTMGADEKVEVIRILHHRMEEGSRLGDEI